MQNILLGNKALNVSHTVAKHRKVSHPDSTLSPPIANVAVTDNVNVTVNDNDNVYDYYYITSCYFFSHFPKKVAHLKNFV